MRSIYSKLTGFLFLGTGIFLVLNGGIKITGAAVGVLNKIPSLNFIFGVLFIAASLVLFTGGTSLKTKARNTLLGILLGGSNLISQPGQAQIPSAGENLEIKTEYTESEPKERKYPTGFLEGRKVGDLYSKYLGVSGRIPEELTIDFEEQLDEMWDQKEKISESKTVTNFRKKVVDKFDADKSEKTTFKKYQSEAQSSIDEINKNIDWDVVKKAESLDSNELEILKNISNSINGKDLMAYALTELMPGKDGAMNVDIMDFLLKKAGRDFVELIPALSDNKTSYGTYQFTSYSIYDVGGIREGASIVNQALPEDKQIPGSVTKLDDEDHHKAAHLLAIDNLAKMINSLSNKEKETLKKKWKKNKDDIVKFVATAHHAPKYARQAAKRWLDNDAKLDFTVSCSDRIRGYSEKTNANFNELYHPTKRELTEFAKFSKLEGKFQSTKKKNSEGFEVFKYVVKKGDTPSSISTKFNKENLNQGDQFAKTGYGNVVNASGKQIKKLNIHDEVYFLAREKENTTTQKPTPQTTPKYGGELFKDLNTVNSEGFNIFKYKVKNGDTPLGISDKFDTWDKEHGNIYKNAGDLNIVNKKGKPIKELTKGQEIYVKARKI